MSAQETAEAVEATLESVEEMQQIAKNNPVLLVGVALVSAAAGAGVTYFVLNKKLKTKYEKIADNEIEDAKEFYRQKYKAEEYSEPDELAKKYADVEEVVNEEPEEIEQAGMVKAAAEILETQKYTSYSETEPSDHAKVEVQESIQKNIFETSTVDDGGFDLDDELDKKRDGKPYILEAEEFFENESEYSQTTLTYFEGDNILADEQDKPISHYLSIIGADNLKFGYGSKDKNIVYIRNDRLSAEYEVTRSTGKYSEEVAGYIEHSEKPRIRKFRNDDD